MPEPIPPIKCLIEWVDHTGEPTPDENDAIGVVVPIGRSHRDARHAFPICADHAKRVNPRAWGLVRFPGPCPACNGTTDDVHGLICRVCRGTGNAEPV